MKLFDLPQKVIQGIAMLTSVLHAERAIAASISIMETVSRFEPHGSDRGTELQHRRHEGDVVKR